MYQYMASNGQWQISAIINYEGKNRIREGLRWSPKAGGLKPLVKRCKSLGKSNVYIFKPLQAFLNLHRVLES